MKVLSVIALVFVLAIGITMFVSWRKANQPPEWWHPVNPADPQVDQAARKIENEVSNQLTRVRPAPANAAEPATWTMIIKDEDANAWLCARLMEWLANKSETLRWPANASEPQVSFEEGVVRLGFEAAVNSGDKGRVISLALAPRIESDGGLWLTMQGFAIGRMQVPPSLIVDAGGTLLEGKLPENLQNNPDTKNFIEALSGKQALTKEAVVKLSDGRKVQIVRITPKLGELELELRTLPR